MSTRQKLVQLRGLILDIDFNRGAMIEAIVEGLPPEILGFSGAVRNDSREEIFEYVHALWEENHDVKLDRLINSLRQHRNGESKDMAPLHDEDNKEGGRRRRTRRKRRRKKGRKKRRKKRKGKVKRSKKRKRTHSRKTRKGKR